MKDRDKIIAYMKAKRLALFKLTGINLYNRADYNEIRKLDDDECKRIWEKLSEKDEDLTNFCPQCVINDRCSDCGYGERHGKCNYGKDGNTWHKILDGGFMDSSFSICGPTC